MSRPIIEVRGISKKYRLGKVGMTSFREEFSRLFNRNGDSTAEEAVRAKSDFWALRDVNFDVQPGEVIGIIGRNGAGKSTLLKILSRITEPTSGEIRIRGRIASLLEVGTGFHPELSGRENVFLNGAILGMNRAEIRRKFDEIVEFSEIGAFIDTPVKRYSSGMYVRLAFAVAAHLEPEILVVDEVLAVGDAHFQEKCVGKMHDVSVKQGRTVIFVSHNMPTVRHLCGRVVWMKNGTVFDQGKTQEVTEKYLLEVFARENKEGHADNGKFSVQLSFIENETGREVPHMFFGKNYTLVAKVASNGSKARHHLLLEVTNSSNDIVSSICSREEGVPWFKLERPTAFHSQFAPLQLLPGGYNLNALLFDAESGQCVLESRSMLSFRVHESRLEKADVPYRGDHGVARVCTQFDMRPL